MMMANTKFSILILSAFASLANAQSCPKVHIFGARETTVSPGLGSAKAFIDMILKGYPSATSEAINYPACGGQSSCGGVQYGDSAKQGTAAVATAVNEFHTRCPDTKIVLVGYSQGGQIMDNALCGGGDSGAGISDTSVPISAGAVKMVKAAILMGDPRYVSGLAYGVGTCKAKGFDARAAGFNCPSADRVQLYCDAEDPYCCDGNDANHHQQYVSIYGKEAFAFVNDKLQEAGRSASGDESEDNEGNDDGGSGTGNDDSNSGDGGGSGLGTGTGGSSSCAARWGQCGGQMWTGPTCCLQGTCRSFNQYYSQCL